MFIDYASGNVLKTRAKPSRAARRSDFAGVASEQRAKGRMFVDDLARLACSWFLLIRLAATHQSSGDRGNSEREY